MFLIAEIALLTHETVGALLLSFGLCRGCGCILLLSRRVALSLRITISLRFGALFRLEETWSLLFVGCLSAAFFGLSHFGIAFSGGFLICVTFRRFLAVGIFLSRYRSELRFRFPSPFLGSGSGGRVLSSGLLLRLRSVGVDFGSIFLGRLSLRLAPSLLRRLVGFRVGCCLLALATRLGSHFGFRNGLIV